MINLDKAKKVFEQYVSNYDRNNDKVLLKINHTYRVMKCAKNIAISLNLTQDEIDLATLIGLLHDIGRFEQLKRYDSYIDSQTIDHANLAVEILFDDGLIDSFVAGDEQIKEVIKTAIYNHNKYAIEDNLDDQILMHCKIIRDADKIDIFNTGLIESIEAFQGVSQDVLEHDVISRHIYDTFMNNETVVSTTRKTSLDCWVSFLALIFDLHYQYSYEYILKNDFINRLIDKYDYYNQDTNEQMEMIRIHANNYLKNIIS